MTKDVRKNLELFNSLPDDAVIGSGLTAIVSDLSERTVRYHPDLPRRQISRGRYGQRVGDVRKLLRQGISEAV
jgi:hypothetical protein